MPTKPTVGNDFFDNLDRETLEILDGGQNLDKEKLAEVKRHNKVVEHHLIFKGKKEEHEYVFNLLQNFMQLKKEGMCTLDIIKFFPDMAQFA